MKTLGSDSGGRSGCVIAVVAGGWVGSMRSSPSWRGVTPTPESVTSGGVLAPSDVPQDATISTASAVTRTPRRGGRCDMGWTQSTAGSPETQVARSVTTADAGSEAATDGAT
jgi:hypothetical protein